MKFASIIFVVLCLQACAISQQGHFKTPNNKELTFKNGDKSVVVAPGPLTAKVDYAFDKVHFENPKNNKVKIPFFGATVNPNKIADYEKELISHYGTHSEIIITNIGAPYTDQEEQSCTTRGNCPTSENAVNCAGAIFGEHSSSSEYSNRKNDSTCTKTTNYYIGHDVMCSGKETVYITKQQYSAYDSFDFFNVITGVAEGYFDSETTQRTKELSRSTSSCRISNSY